MMMMLSSTTITRPSGNGPTDTGCKDEGTFATQLAERRPHHALLRCFESSGRDETGCVSVDADIFLVPIRRLVRGSCCVSRNRR